MIKPLLLILFSVTGIAEACSGFDFGPEFVNIACPSGELRTIGGGDRSCFIVDSGKIDVYRLVKLRLGVPDVYGDFGETNSVLHIYSRYGKNAVNVFSFKKGSFLAWDSKYTLAQSLERRLYELREVFFDTDDVESKDVSCDKLGYKDIEGVKISECVISESGEIYLKILNIADGSLETNILLNFGSHSGMCGPQIWPADSINPATSGRYKF